GGVNRGAGAQDTGWAVGVDGGGRVRGGSGPGPGFRVRDEDVSVQPVGSFHGHERKNRTAARRAWRGVFRLGELAVFRAPGPRCRRGSGSRPRPCRCLGGGRGVVASPAGRCVTRGLVGPAAPSGRRLARSRWLAGAPGRFGPRGASTAKQKDRDDPSCRVGVSAFIVSFARARSFWLTRPWGVSFPYRRALGKLGVISRARGGSASPDRHDQSTLPPYKPPKTTHQPLGAVRKLNTAK